MHVLPGVHFDINGTLLSSIQQPALNIIESGDFKGYVLLIAGAIGQAVRRTFLANIQRGLHPTVFLLIRLDLHVVVQETQYSWLP